MSNYQLILGDCLDVMRGMEAGSVQTCVTSPPYFGLRAYLDSGHEDKHREIGTEDSPEAFVAKLVDVFREVKRLLRDDGTLWLNLGDSMLPNKCEAMIPHRVAMALMEDGWICRSTIIWHKPNPLPESVRDRPTKSHEYIFLLSKSREYFYDADAIREEQKIESLQRLKRGWNGNGDRGYPNGPQNHLQNYMGKSDEEIAALPGRNRRSVWSVPTRSYKGSHFATFPPDLIEPCILAGTSEKGCCAACGAPWVRVVERVAATSIECPKTQAAHEARGGVGKPTGTVGKSGSGRIDGYTTTVGWQPTCTCDTDVAPCVVLDPFSGAATTGMVALKHGRRYIGIELNPDYIKLSHERIGKTQPLLWEAS